MKAVSENSFQVLGRQVALGEDEEAPEDPGAVGWLFIWWKSRSFSIFLVKANLSRFMAGTLALNLVRYILLLKKSEQC